jgi:flagellar basal-body rod protein FlgF
MSDGIYSALSGAVAQQQTLDVIANNVANVGTTGYRGDRLTFQEVLSRGGGGPLPDGLRYVAIANLGTDASSGPLQQTHNPLDLAIQGDGLFSVRSPEGVRYTRAGSFMLDPEGAVRTHSGLPVLGADGAPVTLPPDASEVTIGRDGTLTVDGVEGGQLALTTFGAGELEKEGLTLFRPVDGAAGRPLGDGEGQVLQGYLEGSNVNAVEGMSELIEANRAFDAFHRVIQAFKQIDERTAREVGRGG